MKTKPLLLLLLPAIVLLMTGCPVGLDYPIGTPGTEAINPALVGTWVNSADETEVKRVRIDKTKDNSYEVVVLERGEMYALESDKFKAWVTTVEEKSFFYLKPYDEEKYYHYCYWMDGGTLITCDMSLTEGGVDALTSTESLREQVAKSMKKEDWGTETQEWIKD